jgi:hypothetical protein
MQHKNELELSFTFIIVIKRGTLANLATILLGFTVCTLSKKMREEEHFNGLDKTLLSNANLSLIIKQV